MNKKRKRERIKERNIEQKLKEVTKNKCKKLQEENEKLISINKRIKKE